MDIHTYYAMMLLNWYFVVHKKKKKHSHHHGDHMKQANLRRFSNMVDGLLDQQISDGTIC